MWYSGVNPKALIHGLEMGIPDFLAPAAHLYYKYKFKKKCSYQLENGETIQASYQDVWDRIREKLAEKDSDLNFISFDDHGWVISFDEEIIRKQNEESKLYDKRLIEQLGFAGIESWLSADLDLWYKNQALRV